MTLLTFDTILARYRQGRPPKSGGTHRQARQTGQARQAVQAVQPREGETRIPGFSRYAIGGDCQVISYTSGEPRVMKVHPNGCVNLMPDYGCRADKFTVNLSTLVICAMNGIDPRRAGGIRRKFLLAGGEIIDCEEYRRHTAGIRPSERPAAAGATDGSQAQADTQEAGIQAQRKGSATGDWGDALAIIYGEKRICCAWLCRRFEVRWQTAEWHFGLAVDEIIARMTEGCIYPSLRSLVYGIARRKLAARER